MHSRSLLNGQVKRHKSFYLEYRWPRSVQLPTSWWPISALRLFEIDRNGGFRVRTILDRTLIRFIGKLLMLLAAEMRIETGPAVRRNWTKFA